MDVVVHQVEQSEEDDLRIEGQTLEFVPQRRDAQAQAEVERKERVIAHLARRSEIKFRPATGCACERRCNRAKSHQLTLSKQPRRNERLSRRRELVPELVAHLVEELVQITRFDVPAERT